MEITRHTRKDGSTITRTKFKMVSKEKGIEMLARHLSLFTDVVQVKGITEAVREMSDDELRQRIKDLEQSIEDEEARHGRPANNPPTKH